MMVKHLRLILLMLTIFITGLTVAEAHNPKAVQAVIGDGTAASCQTQTASNALRDAVAAGGVITFNCGPDMVIMTVDTNATDQIVTVNGNGKITLSGEDLRQIFYVFGTGSLTLSDLTLIDGDFGSGGAIFVGPQASATIHRTIFIGNHAATHGGAIYNRGTLTINNGLIGSNIANNDGGGIYNDEGTVVINDTYLISNQAVNGGAFYSTNGAVTVGTSAFRSNIATGLGGGVYVSGTAMEIANTTFSNNKADSGGGVYKNSTLTLINNTFNENLADSGGALYNAGGTTTVRNNIFANSLDEAGASLSLNCDGPTLPSEGRNIVSDNSCVPNPSVVGDLLATDPLLGIWQNNGGPTRSYEPLPNSPAIDYGLNCPAVDQRGLPRPLGSACDVGSIEYGGILYLPVISK